jgi:hypothetical protein
MLKWTTIDVTVPKEGSVVRMNAWWACVDGDKTKALFYGKAPQCNSQKAMVEWCLNKDKFYPENTQAVFIEVAYTPNRDY